MIIYCTSAILFLRWMLLFLQKIINQVLVQQNQKFFSKIEQFKCTKRIKLIIYKDRFFPCNYWIKKQVIYYIYLLLKKLINNFIEISIQNFLSILGTMQTRREYFKNAFSNSEVKSTTFKTQATTTAGTLKPKLNSTYKANSINQINPNLSMNFSTLSENCFNQSPYIDSGSNIYLIPETKKIFFNYFSPQTMTVEKRYFQTVNHESRTEYINQWQSRYIELERQMNSFLDIHQKMMQEFLKTKEQLKNKGQAQSRNTIINMNKIETMLKQNHYLQTQTLNSKISRFSQRILQLENQNKIFKQKNISLQQILQKYQNQVLNDLKSGQQKNELKLKLKQYQLQNSKKTAQNISYLNEKYNLQQQIYKLKMQLAEKNIQISQLNLQKQNSVNDEQKMKFQQNFRQELNGIKYQSQVQIKNLQQLLNKKDLFIDDLKLHAHQLEKRQKNLKELKQKYEFLFNQKRIQLNENQQLIHLINQKHKEYQLKLSKYQEIMKNKELQFQHRENEIERLNSQIKTLQQKNINIQVIQNQKQRIIKEELIKVNNNLQKQLIHNNELKQKIIKYQNQIINIANKLSRVPALEQENSQLKLRQQKLSQLQAEIIYLRNQLQNSRDLVTQPQKTSPVDGSFTVQKLRSRVILSETLTRELNIETCERNKQINERINQNYEQALKLIAILSGFNLINSKQQEIEFAKLKDEIQQLQAERESLKNKLQAQLKIKSQLLEQIQYLCNKVPQQPKNSGSLDIFTVEKLRSRVILSETLTRELIIENCQRNELLNNNINQNYEQIFSLVVLLLSSSPSNSKETEEELNKLRSKVSVLQAEAVDLRKKFEEQLKIRSQLANQVQHLRTLLDQQQGKSGVIDTFTVQKLRSRVILSQTLTQELAIENCERNKELNKNINQNYQQIFKLIPSLFSFGSNNSKQNEEQLNKLRFQLQTLDTQRLGLKNKLEMQTKIKQQLARQLQSLRNLLAQQQSKSGKVDSFTVQKLRSRVILSQTLTRELSIEDCQRNKNINKNINQNYQQILNLIVLLFSSGLNNSNPNQDQLNQIRYQVEALGTENMNLRKKLEAQLKNSVKIIDQLQMARNLLAQQNKSGAIDSFTVQNLRSRIILSQTLTRELSIENCERNKELNKAIDQNYEQVLLIVSALFGAGFQTSISPQKQNQYISKIQQMQRKLDQFVKINHYNQQMIRSLFIQIQCLVQQNSSTDNRDRQINNFLSLQIQKGFQSIQLLSI